MKPAASACVIPTCYICIFSSTLVVSIHSCIDISQQALPRPACGCSVGLRAHDSSRHPKSKLNPIQNPDTARLYTRHPAHRCGCWCWQPGTGTS